MMKTSSLLLGTLFILSPAVQSKQAPTSGPVQIDIVRSTRASKIEANVQKRGVGENSQVRVKLLNGHEIAGYLSKIEMMSFSVTDKKTNQTTTISYEEVQRVRGHSFHWL